MNRMLRILISVLSLDNFVEAEKSDSCHCELRLNSLEEPGWWQISNRVDRWDKCSNKNGDLFCICDPTSATIECRHSFKDGKRPQELQVLPNDVMRMNLANAPIRKENRLILPAGTFYGLGRLVELELYNLNLEYLPQYALKDLVQLEQLKINNGAGLSHTNRNALPIAPNAFKYLGKLKYLDLSENNILDLNEDIFKNNPNLESIQLEGNSLTMLSPKLFNSQREVTYLSLRNNRIREVGNETFKGLEELERLTLSSNKIRRWQRNPHLGKLKSLHLSMNAIESIESEGFTNMDKLENLYLNENDLAQIDFNAFPENLRHLELNGNYINKISSRRSDGSFPLFHLLTVLHLNKNSLTTFPIKLLEQLPALEILDLSDNMLVQLDASSLPSSTRTIDVSHNMLTSITGRSHPVLEQLHTLRLQGNPLHCDCALQKLMKSLLDKKPEENFGRDVVTCSTPSELNGMAVTEIIWQAECLS